MLTEMRDTVGLTMLGMGKDPSKATSTTALAAVDKIDKANRDGQIRRFTGNDYIKDLTKGDSWLIYGWSGDAVQLQRSNPNIEFLFPPEGFMFSTDNMQIPVGAPHAYTAEVFMNYVYDPEVQAKIAESIKYVTPVKGVKEVLGEEGPEAGRERAHLPVRRAAGSVPHLPRPAAGRGAGARQPLPGGDRRVISTAAPAR